MIEYNEEFNYISFAGMVLYKPRELAHLSIPARRRLAEIEKVHWGNPDWGYLQSERVLIAEGLYQPKETDITQLVEDKITQLFEDLAAELQVDLVAELQTDSPDTAACIPFVLFEAQQHMVRAWRKFIKERTK